MNATLLTVCAVFAAVLPEVPAPMYNNDALNAATAALRNNFKENNRVGWRLNEDEVFEKVKNPGALFPNLPVLFKKTMTFKDIETAIEKDPKVKVLEDKETVSFNTAYALFQSIYYKGAKTIDEAEATAKKRLQES